MAGGLESAAITSLALVPCYSHLTLARSAVDRSITVGAGTGSSGLGSWVWLRCTSGKSALELQWSHSPNQHCRRPPPLNAPVRAIFSHCFRLLRGTHVQA
ncbi:hypothetical protein B0I72DRAFT_133964 [Yarrowia lipolytica]|nr:hypothetical protein B0I72DRAFT_133964 [Yarrowia lipolytica]RDW47781.1 hypothetical protein B0I74DRAFT_134723 [Yarrowia lipolytica]RDW54001.1 hypothetical protein B0I75DRAFT_135407 [Yarrowia lipolytica]